MAQGLLPFLFCLACAGQGADAISRSEAEIQMAVSHLGFLERHQKFYVKNFGKTFPWMKKWAVELMADEMNAMSEMCFASCEFGKMWHKAMCRGGKSAGLHPEKALPLFYGGKLLKKDSNNMCEVLTSDPKDFWKKCANNCRSNTENVLFLVVDAASRKIEGKSESEKKEAKDFKKDGYNKVESDGDNNNRLRLDEEYEGLRAQFEPFAHDSQDGLPTWVAAVMFAGLLAMVFMGRTILKLKAQLRERYVTTEVSEESLE